MASPTPSSPLRDELRLVRLPEPLEGRAARRAGVESTVVVFGSARFKAPDVAEAMLRDALASGDEAATARARQMVKNARWYEGARAAGELVTRESEARLASR